MQLDLKDYKTTRTNRCNWTSRITRLQGAIGPQGAPCPHTSTLHELTGTTPAGTFEGTNRPINSITPLMPTDSVVPDSDQTSPVCIP